MFQEPVSIEEAATRLEVCLLDEIGEWMQDCDELRLQDGIGQQGGDAQVP